MNKIIALDVDGVLADFTWGFTAKGKQWFGAPVFKTQQQQCWDHWVGIDAEQENTIWKHIKSSPDFWRMLDSCCPNYVFGTLQQISTRYPLYFITNRPGETAKQQTEGWLQDRGVWNPTVVISGKKGDAVQALGVTHYIDDKAGNSVFAKYQNKHANVYLLDRPYNRFDQTVVGTKVKRVDSVEQFLKEAMSD